MPKFVSNLFSRCDLVFFIFLTRRIILISPPKGHMLFKGNQSLTLRSKANTSCSKNVFFFFLFLFECLTCTFNDYNVNKKIQDNLSYSLFLFSLLSFEFLYLSFLFVFNLPYPLFHIL